MKKLTTTLNLDKKEWLKYRKQGIGGSDAGAVCGLNPYRTAIHVYQDKISDETEDIDNEAMRQGREFEDYVARRFMEATGKKVRRANAMFQDEKNLFMLADVDRMVVGENAGLECKTASPYMADKWEDGKIPMSYQIQCYHYMSVCNADAWYIAVLIYGREFKFYKIERDEQIIADLIQIERDFWENHVLKQVMPDPDGSKTADSVIAEYFKTVKAENIPLTGFDEKLRRRQELVAVIEKMDTEKKQIEQELKIYLGEAETAENESFRVSWKQVCTNRLDEKKLKEEQPEVYEKYRKQTVSRRFTVKSSIKGSCYKRKEYSMTGKTENMKAELAKKAETTKGEVKLKKSMSIEDLIKAMEPEIKKALPEVITPERFTRMALSALNTTPKLRECTQISFLAALMNAAQLGLEPNTPLGQAYLIPYNNKGVMECQFQIGYKGLIDLSYRNPQMQIIAAQAVYENDEFEYELGLNPKLEHRPALENRGEVKLFYGLFKLNNGGFGFEVMSKSAVDAYAKEYSKAFDSSFSPWKSNYVGMAKKTVIKQALKYAPLKTDFRKALSTDETIKTELCEDMSEIQGKEIFDAEYQEITE